MLQLVEAYIAYGEANLKSVRELIYKIIEEALGKHGIVSSEDLVHASLCFPFAPACTGTRMADSASLDEGAPDSMSDVGG